MNLKNLSDFYDQKAQYSSYENGVFPRFSLAPYEFIWKYFSNIPSSTRVLDIGCGSGLHSTYFAKYADFVHGIDISQKSLDIAQKKARTLNIDNKCRFDNKDFLNLEVKGKYDILFASGVLYYFDLGQAKEKILLHLKDNGTFCAIETVGDNHLLNIYRKTKNFFFKYRDEKTLHSLLKISDIKSLAQKFSSHQIHYFDFLTLLLKPIQNVPIMGNFLLNLARRLDYILLNKMGLRKLSFKMVLIAKK